MHIDTLSVGVRSFFNEKYDIFLAKGFAHSTKSFII